MKLVIVSFPGMTYLHLKDILGKESVRHMDASEFLTHFTSEGPHTFVERATAIKETFLVVSATPPVAQCLRDHQFPHWVVMHTREAALTLTARDVRLDKVEKFPITPAELTREILEAPGGPNRIGTLTLNKAPWKATMSDTFLWLLLGTLMRNKNPL